MSEEQIKATIRSYDEIADKYVALYPYPSERINRFAKLIPKNGKILDAGCGPGFDTQYLAKRGFDLTGIDLSPKMIELAKKRVPQATYLNTDIRSLDFQPETFDGILAVYSLCYVPKTNIAKVLKDFHNFLKPNGFFYFAFQEGESRETIHPESLKPGNNLFLNIMSHAEVKNLLKTTGFKTIYLFSRPPQDKDINFNKYYIIAQKI